MRRSRSNQPQDTIETESEKQIQKQLENGVKLMVTSKMHEAKAIFKACLTRVDRTRMEQTFRSASFNLGNVHLGLNEPREALRHFMKLRNLTPEFLHVHLAEQFTGAALAQLGRAEEAIHAWDNAIAARKAQRNGTHDHDFWLAVWPRDARRRRRRRRRASVRPRRRRTPSPPVSSSLRSARSTTRVSTSGRHTRPPRPPVGARPPAARPGRGEQSYVGAALTHLRKAVALKPQRAGAWPSASRVRGRARRRASMLTKGFNAEPAAAHRP